MRASAAEGATATATAEATPQQPPQPPPPRRQTRRERRASTDSAWERRRASSSVCAIPAAEFPLRPVALEVFYLGWAFRGFTTQTSVSSDLSRAASAAASAAARELGNDGDDDDDGTVEAQLFRALRRTGLVPCLVQQPETTTTTRKEKKGEDENGDDNADKPSPPPPPSSSFDAPSTWKDLGYARCGRTDAGVSGMGQVVSLRLRSRLRRFQKVRKSKKKENGEGLFDSEDDEEEELELEQLEQESDSEEIDYPSLLNKALPPEVRVTGWAPLPEDSSFSARFSATAREYRYFFVDDFTRSSDSDGKASRPRGLDLAAMREAASSLVGLHDFRNLCKPDLPAVTNFVRRVYSCEVEEWRGALEDPFAEGKGRPSSSTSTTCSSSTRRRRRRRTQNFSFCRPPWLFCLCLALPRRRPPHPRRRLPAAPGAVRRLPAADGGQGPRAGLGGFQTSRRRSDASEAALRLGAAASPPLLRLRLRSSVKMEEERARYRPGQGQRARAAAGEGGGRGAAGGRGGETGRARGRNGEEIVGNKDEDETLFFFFFPPVSFVALPRPAAARSHHQEARAAVQERLRPSPGREGRGEGVCSNDGGGAEEAGSVLVALAGGSLKGEKSFCISFCFLSFSFATLV